MEEPAGKQLGTYRIVQRLDGEAASDLFLVEHLYLGRRRVLRVIPRKLLDEAGAKRLIEQLHGLALLDHPNLVRVLDAGRTKDGFFIATEHIARSAGDAAPLTLEEHFRALPDGRVPPARTLDWILQAASALEHLHAHGIIHQDLRPASILIDASGNLRIGGAGLAEFLHASAAESAIDAMVSQVVARSRGDADAAPAAPAAEHLAPEQRAGKEPDARSDIYALGILISQVLCGQKALRLKQPPSQLIPGLNSRWDAILARCTAQSPQGRYPSVSALLAELRLMRKPAMRRRMPAAAGAFILCAIAGAIFLWGPWPASSRRQAALTQPASIEPAAPSIIPPQAAPATLPVVDQGIPLAELVSLKVRAIKAMEAAQRHPPDAQAAPLLDRAATLLREGIELDARGARAEAIVRYEQIPKLCEAFEAAHAQNRARAEEAARQAMSALNRSIDAYGREKLARYGGETWQSLCDALPQPGDDDPAAVLAAVEEATQLLVPATQAADRAWRAEQAALVQGQANAHIAAARTLVQQQRFDEAMQQVGQALALRPGDPAALELRKLLHPHALPKSVDLELEPGVALTALRVLPGRFTMGVPPAAGAMIEGAAAHEVTLTRPFYMGRTEVTRTQFLLFARDAAYRTQAEREGWSDVIYNPESGVPGRVKGLTWKNPGIDQQLNHPAVCLSWSDAVAFCEWLSRKSGRTVRLPTEAEWEYACRAGTATPWSWGDDEADGKDYANVLDLAAGRRFNLNGASWADRDVFTAPAGSYKPNAWGLHDTHGNVSEWCSDLYAPYGREAAVDPAGPDIPLQTIRVIRGGSWFHLPFACTSAYRAKALQTYRNPCLGFRVVVEAPAVEAPATRPRD